jgi:uncharacterized protein
MKLLSSCISVSATVTALLSSSLMAGRVQAQNTICKMDGDIFDNGAVDGDADYNSSPAPRAIPSRSKVIEIMKLQPHPDGGYYRNVTTTETWVYDDADIADGQDGRRPAMNVVEFMLTPKTGFLPDPAMDGYQAYQGILGRSYFHRLTHEEHWTFLHGDTVYLFELDNASENDVKITVLGIDLEAGQVPQYTVPARNWFAAIVNPRSAMEEPYSVLSAVVAPGYETVEFERDWQMGNYDTLVAQYPNAQPQIAEMTFPDLVDEIIDVNKAYAEVGVSSLCKVEYPTVDELRERFSMDESPWAGSNYYSEAFSSAQDVLAGYGTRKALTSQYLVMNSTITWHKAASDEIWSFHFGDSIVIYEIDIQNDATTTTSGSGGGVRRNQRGLQSVIVSNGRVMTVTPLGLDVTQGEVSQHLVKANTWYGVEHKKQIEFVNVTNTTLLTEWEEYFLSGLEASDQRLIDLTQHQDYEIVFNHTIEANYTNSSWFLVQNSTATAFVSVTNSPGISYGEDLELGDLEALSAEYPEFSEKLYELHLRAEFEYKWARGEIESQGPMINWTEADLVVNSDPVDFEVALTTSQSQANKEINNAGLALGIVAMALVMIIAFVFVRNRSRNNKEKQRRLEQQELEIERATPPPTPEPAEPQCSVVVERADGSYEAVRRHSFLKSFQVDQAGQITSTMPDKRRRGHEMRVGDELEDAEMRPYDF